jgi:hypothetical protein
MVDDYEAVYRRLAACSAEPSEPVRDSGPPTSTEPVLVPR